MLLYRPRLFVLTVLISFSVLFLKRMQWILPQFASASSESESLSHVVDLGLLNDIQNVTLGFEKIFVLAMPDRYDRQDLWSLAAWSTKIEFEYFDGVKGENIPAKAVPAGWDMGLMETEPGTLGCYRSHLNIMRKMVSDRIQTALILEDDADWDVLLRSQLTEFARGAQFVQDAGKGSKPTKSPYGDDWDLLWFGHCGVKSDVRKDGFYYVIDNDPTVLAFEKRSHEQQVRKLDTTPEGLRGNFSRVVFEAGSGLCTYGYALSLRGASRFLYEYSVKPQAPVFDKAMSRFCGGHQSGAKCYTSYPGILDQYKQPGNISKDSDRRVANDDKKTRFRTKGESWNLAFPMKVGLGNFVGGQRIFQSQYPEFTLISEVDPEKLAYPRGHGLFVTKDQFAG